MEKPHRVSLRWMEAEALGPVMALMGLFKDAIPPTHNNYKSMQTRMWRSSLQRNMGANLAFVVFNHTDGEKRIKAFLNENPIHIPGCYELTCNITEIVEAWEDIAINCYLPAICDLPNNTYDYEYWSDETLEDSEIGDIQHVWAMIQSRRNSVKENITYTHS